jgi:hypothetical protein
MPALNDALLALFNQLETSLRIRLYCAATLRSQWFRPPAEICALAGVSHRRGEIELAKLVREGWLERHDKGSANHTRLSRFVPSAPINLIGAQGSPRSGRSDQSDRGAGIEVIGAPRSDRSGHSSMDAGARARAPDLSLDPRSMEQRVRPSGEVLGGDPVADGRTDDGDPRAELRNALVHRVAARWQLSARIVTPGLMRLLNAGATERELQAFLVDAERGTHPAFDGVGGENRFGRSCTAERFAVWRKSREPRRAAPREREPELEPQMGSPDEVEAFVELAKLEMKRGLRS